MATREEIEAGVTNILEEAGAGKYARKVLYWLDSEGCALKVEGDLSEIKQFKGQTRRILIQAGYTATESLIGEKNE